MIAYLIAAAVIGCAAYILYRRVRDFIRTKGASACENCPYHGLCHGHCGRNDTHE